MTIHFTIPDSVVQAMRLPESEIQTELTTELALSLYARGILSFGKARELAQISKQDFALLLNERNIARHYGDDELTADVEYANSK